MAMDGEENDHSIENIYKEQREKKTQHKNLHSSVNYVYIGIRVEGLTGAYENWEKDGRSFVVYIG